MRIQFILSSLLISASHLGLCSSEGGVAEGQCNTGLASEIPQQKNGAALIQVQKSSSPTENHRKRKKAQDDVAVETCDPPDRDGSPLPALGENASLAYSSLHDVVGTDGVLMIALDHVSTRYAYAAHKLNRIGIRPVKFTATDGSCASKAALARGCGLVNDSEYNLGCKQSDERAGYGCVNRAEQAISDSHRRALEYAYMRDGSKWTAILEDDAVPAAQDGYDWNMMFSEAWSKLPEGAKIVRLSWCTQPEFQPPAEPPQEEGQFTFKQSWELMSLGGCTTAYMVHHDIIPEMLKVFPCCGALDACYAWDFFLKPDRQDSWGKKHMETVLWNLDATNSSNWMSSQHISKWGHHFGVMMQNTEDALSTRAGRVLLQESNA